MRNTLATFEPRTFPTDTAAVPEIADEMATASSGKEVLTAINVKPMLDLLTPVDSDTLIAFLMATWLLNAKVDNDTAIFNSSSIRSLLCMVNQRKD